jgi:hypothetical protein
MPLWYVKLMLRMFIREHRWRQMDPLLETALQEHEQVAALDDGSAERYRSVTARVVLLGGGASRSLFTTTLFDQLTAVIPNCTSELIDGLDHLAPDEKGPGLVAERVRYHLGVSPGRG